MMNETSVDEQGKNFIFEKQTVHKFIIVSYFYVLSRPQKKLYWVIQHPIFYQLFEGGNINLESTSSPATIPINLVENKLSSDDIDKSSSTEGPGSKLFHSSIW